MNKHKRDAFEERAYFERLEKQVADQGDTIDELRCALDRISLALRLENSVKKAIEILNEVYEDYDPTPCCHAHGVGALATSEPCPKPAENE